MLRAWRGGVVAAVVAGTAIAAQLAVIAPAQAAAPTITIAAKSEIKPVTGDVFVVYHVSAVSSAKLAGTITGGAAGEMAALYAQPFPYKKAGARVASITLKAAKPKWLYLNGGNPTVTKSRRLSASEFENTLTFSFTIGNHGYYFVPGYCTKDAESSDGIGLPGRHGCGASRILTASTAYLG